MTDDERQALAAFEELDRALERRDDITFWGPAAPEAAVGRDGLRELLDLLDAVSRSFTLTWAARRVRVSADVAWVNAEGVATWERPGERAARLASRQTAILVRRGPLALAHARRSEPTALDVGFVDGARVDP